MNSKHAWRQFAFALAVIGLPLLVLFRQSFAPGQVVFSNDSPLGAIMSQAGSNLENFSGHWEPLNWVGLEEPSGLPCLTQAIFLLSGPLWFGPMTASILFAKFYTPISLLLLGLSAWFLCRQLRFNNTVGALVGLAAALNQNIFSNAAWGLPTRALTLTGVFMALAAIHSRTPSRLWIRSALAGVAVGFNIMEGFDVGAFFSLYVAAAVLFEALNETGAPMQRWTRGMLRLAVVVIASVLTSAQALSTLIGTQIQGVAGAEQDAQTRQQKWDFATQWSLPKIETLRLIIPGVFGYRMDTEKGGNYWGAVGQTPGNKRTRHSGEGEYAGVLVALVAAWAFFRSLRKKDSGFSDWERKFIWFWSAAAVLSLLLAFGRHAPFYQIIYQLPYFSTIRNPIKFLHCLQTCLLILFGCGLQGLYRSYVEKNLIKHSSWMDQLKGWWRAAPAFDLKWAKGSIAFVVMSLVGWLIYAASSQEMLRYLADIGFPDEFGQAVFGFSSREVGLFLLFLSLSVIVVLLIMSGNFSGARAKWAGLTLGLLLAVDLARANAPFINYVNYPLKYHSNPVIDFLRNESPRNRVTGEFYPLTRQFLVSGERGQIFGSLYYDEWLQYQFQFYNVHSLDIIQMSRGRTFDEGFLTALHPASNQLFRCARVWQLTNTRYVLGMTSLLPMLNQQMDPAKQRFRVHTTFDLAPKPGVASAVKIEDLTAVTITNGPFALFEFTGALPRARLYTHWEVSTNDAATLQRLADPAFDPEKTVLVANEVAGPAASGSEASGTVTITRYLPKHVELKTSAPAAALLLLNDRFHAHWKVRVDGQSQPMLRCNYLVRGVHLSAGEHTVNFDFDPPAGALYVSLAAIVAGLGLCGFLAFGGKPAPVPVANESEKPSPPTSKNPKRER